MTLMRGYTNTTYPTSAHGQCGCGRFFRSTHMHHQTCGGCRAVSRFWATRQKREGKGYWNGRRSLAI